MTVVLVTIAILMMLLGAGSVSIEDSSLHKRFERAAHAIVRMTPSAFSDLPLPIKLWMSERGFAVPQSYCDSLLHNVIHARFDENEHDDWATLCSRTDTSWVVVFWDGTADRVTMLHPSNDLHFLQTTGPHEIGYSRILVVETPETILSRYREWGVTAPEWIIHDGIGDVYCEKASSILYWREGRLEYLLGAD
jgi:hypothetical protein